MLDRKSLPGPLIVVAVLLGVSVFINYIDRSNLAIAAPLLKDELSISPAQLGFLLSAFFWTYALLQPVYGWLVDRLNVYWVLAAGYCFWSVATAATGLVHTFTVLLAFRLIVGIGEAVAFPSYSKIITLNYPEERRGIANAAVTAGLSLGPGLGLLLGGTMMARFGWRPFFVVLGLASLIWLPPWIKWAPSKNVVPPSDSTSAPTLLEFLSLRSAWGTCIGLFCSNYINYFMLTWLPYYIMRELHYSMTAMAKIAAAGYFLSAASALITGRIADHWIASGATPTRVRKTFCAGAGALSGIFLGLSAFCTSPALAVVFILLAMSCFGASASNLWAISQTLAGPHAAGRWVGFQNCFGNMAGAVVPVVTGFVVGRTGHFQWALAIVTVVCLIGSAAWLFLIGRVEQVSWHRKPALRFATAKS